MNPKAVAGVTGVVGLAVVGFIGFNSSPNRSRRDLSAVVQDADYELAVDDFEAPDFVDEWEDNNSTDLWKQFNADLGIELSEDDVQMKQEAPGGRRGGKRPNFNKFRESQLKAMIKPMQEEFVKRQDALSFYNEISGIKMGKRDPSDFGTAMDDEGDYAGYDKTAPIVNQFLSAFNCQADGSSNFRNGAKTNVWIVVPEAVPLWSEEGNHISDWSNYWQFLLKFASGWPTKQREFRFSLGVYGSSASFTPRGYRFRENTPWGRMQRYYKKPRMSAARPKLFSSIRSTLTYLPRYGVSTSTAGDNCVLFWFFQDVPRDLNDFMVPEEFEMINELHSVCTVIPVVVAPDADSDQWKAFVANFMPGLRKKYAKDPDFNGAFHVKSFAGLVDDDFHAHINNYLCLVENRATCRIYADAWKEPSYDEPTGDPTEGFRGLEDDYDSTDAPAGTDAAATTASDGTTMEPTTKKDPEIDSCCGHNGPSATPFDSELKTCCEDGSVKSYEFEGDDPCLANEFFK